MVGELVRVSLNATGQRSHGKGPSALPEDTHKSSLSGMKCTAKASVYTCDFSYDYVKINADYRS